MQCPLLLQNLIIADDARLAAQISCVLATAGAYLPIIDGPRMARQDRDVEVVRRNNAAGRLKPNSIILAGLSDASENAIRSGFRPTLRSKIVRIDKAGVNGLPCAGRPLELPPLAAHQKGDGIARGRIGRSQDV